MNNDPKLAIDYKCQCGDSPIISVVIPVFNQQSNIIKNINSVLCSMSLPFELLVMDDASTDDTLHVLKENLLNTAVSCPLLTSIQFFAYQKSAYETKCDSFGFLTAQSNYILEIQADMEITEKGFDGRMLEALRKFPDLIMVSGRGAEKIEDIYPGYIKAIGAGRFFIIYFLKYLFVRRIKHAYKAIFNSGDRRLTKDNYYEGCSDEVLFPEQEGFKKSGRAGRLGLHIESNIPILEKYKNKIWLSETVMRGPLLVDKKKYLEVGGFDSERFFLGYDDHDLAMRAWNLKGYRSGYVPVGFLSPLADGATRKMRTIKQEFEILSNLVRTQNVSKESALYSALKVLKDKNINIQIREF